MKQLLLHIWEGGLAYQLQVNSTPAKTQILVAMTRTKHDYSANTGMSKTDLTGAMAPHTHQKRKEKKRKRLNLAGSSKKEEYFCGDIIQIRNFSILPYITHDFKVQ